MMSDIVLAGLLDVISIIPACICISVLLYFFNRCLK